MTENNGSCSKPKISVIIPVYNVEKYLEECLNSVTNQTLKDIEIICIDDGSTDNSGKILDEYAKKDDRFKIIHKENQGAGAARNEGIELGKGKYFIFFDSDDYFSDLKALEKLYNKAIQEDSDITICRSQKLEQKTGEILKKLEYSIKTEFLPKNSKTFSPNEISPYIFQFCVGWPWDKLYKSSFIRENNIQYQNLRHSNDTFFVLISLVLADKISIIEDYFIIHRFHDSSLANTRNKAPECFIQALQALYSELKRRELLDLYNQSFINYYIQFSLWHICTIKNSKSQNIMIKKTKHFAKKINLNKYNKDYYYDYKEYLKYKNITNFGIKFMNRLTQLFSLTNTKDKRHKVITILGIKLKIRRKEAQCQKSA